MPLFSGLLLIGLIIVLVKFTKYAWRTRNDSKRKHW